MTFNTYVQQLSFDGVTYTKGSVVDLYSAYKIIAQEFPFQINPASKDLPTRDWPDEDGLEIYIPDKIPMKQYEMEVTFLYVGTENTIRTDLVNFIDFIYGRNTDAVGGRLAIYNEYVGIGRKDVMVKEVSNEVYYLTDSDVDAVAQFKVKFTVYDPVTPVTPTYQTISGVSTLTDLSWT